MRGWWQGARASGTGPQPGRVCEALLGSLPVSTREREGERDQGGVLPWEGWWDLWVHASLSLAEAPPPRQQTKQ
jgi:hypothetical protein